MLEPPEERWFFLVEGSSTVSRIFLVGNGGADRANVFYWPEPMEGKEEREAKLCWFQGTPLTGIFGEWRQSGLFRCVCQRVKSTLGVSGFLIYTNISGKSANEVSALPLVVSIPHYLSVFSDVPCAFL